MIHALSIVGIAILCGVIIAMFIVGTKVTKELDATRVKYYASLVNAVDLERRVVELISENTKMKGAVIRAATAETALLEAFHFIGDKLEQVDAKLKSSTSGTFLTPKQ
jgi:hypothetical protein